MESGSGGSLPRRAFLGQLIGASAALGFLGWGRAQAQGAAAGRGPFTLEPLPYAPDALEPAIDAQTMTIHHGRHHQGYVTNLNRALQEAGEPYLSMTLRELMGQAGSLPRGLNLAVMRHGGGHWNHAFFWENLRPFDAAATPGARELQGSAEASHQEFLAMVAINFGSMDGLWQALTAEAMGVFGSGWAWLAVDGDGNLSVRSTTNQLNLLMGAFYPGELVPVLGIDVWEHAYYLRYQNRRGDYLAAIRQVIHWPVVAQRYADVRANQRAAAAGVSGDGQQAAEESEEGSAEE